MRFFSNCVSHKIFWNCCCEWWECQWRDTPGMEYPLSHSIIPRYLMSSESFHFVWHRNPLNLLSFFVDSSCPELVCAVCLLKVGCISICILRDIWVWHTSCHKRQYALLNILWCPCISCLRYVTLKVVIE